MPRLVLSVKICGRRTICGDVSRDRYQRRGTTPTIPRYLDLCAAGVKLWRADNVQANVFNTD